MNRRSLLSLMALAATLAAALAGVRPAVAGSVEVTVRDGDGRTLEQRHLRLQQMATGGETWIPGFARYWHPQTTDATGRATFKHVLPGKYSVEVFIGPKEHYVHPADNPFFPVPEITLLNESEHVALEVVLWRGVRVAVALDLPDDSGGFRAVFRHPGSGLTRVLSFPRGTTSIERLLPPGVWDVDVEPRPGYLLVALDRDRVPLPGHSARLDLLHEPATTFLTWTYVTPSEIEGTAFTEEGRVAPVEIVATLVEPGPWYPAAIERGGSIFDRLTASPDPIHGTYRMLVPDGRWQVEPEAPLLLASEPEAVDLDLVPGETGRADFTVRMGKGRGGGRLFVVEVENVRGSGLRQATVEVADDPPETAEPLRSGVTGDFGRVELEGLDAGRYRVIAGHVDYLEGRIELPGYDPEDSKAWVIPPVVLPDGAEIRLRARDPAGEPLAGVELTVERLGEDPDTEHQTQDVVEAKRVRTAVTDQSGRTSIRGFYPGTYQARARLRGKRGTQGVILLGLAGGEQTGLRESSRPRRELRHPEGGQTINIEIAGSEAVELDGSVLPAASLSAALLCSDGWDLPDTVAVRVFAAYDAGQHELDPRDFNPEDATDDTPGIALAADGMLLAGRSRDALTVGPFEQGVYYLALKPQDFDRWTWAFETHDPAEASRIQVDVTNGGNVVQGDVDLGLFAVECAPAVDLLPAVADLPATGGRHDFPDVREVEVDARFFDLDAGKQVGQRRLSITRRDGRIRLRGCPEGRLRLDFTLTHPHLLPEPALSWQVELELERGWYRQIFPEIEALGGSILISGDGTTAVAYGLDGATRQASFHDGEAELPSLAPGRYRVEVSDADGPIRVWHELEVRAGETLRLEARPRSSAEAEGSRAGL